MKFSRYTENKITLNETFENTLSTNYFFRFSFTPAQFAVKNKKNLQKKIK